MGGTFGGITLGFQGSRLKKTEKGPLKYRALPKKNLQNESASWEKKGNRLTF